MLFKKTYNFVLVQVYGLENVCNLTVFQKNDDRLSALGGRKESYGRHKSGRKTPNLGFAVELCDILLVTPKENHEVALVQGVSLYHNIYLLCRAFAVLTTRGVKTENLATLRNIGCDNFLTREKLIELCFVKARTLVVELADYGVGSFHNEYRCRGGNKESKQQPLRPPTFKSLLPKHRNAKRKKDDVFDYRLSIRKQIDRSETMTIVRRNVKKKRLCKNVESERGKKSHRYPPDAPLAKTRNKGKTQARFNSNKQAHKELGYIPRKELVFKHKHIHRIQ